MRASVDGVHPAAFPAVFEFRQAADSAHVEPVLAAFRANRKAGGAQGIVGGSALLEGGGGALPETRPSAALLETDTDTVTVLEAVELAVVPGELPLPVCLLVEALLEELALLPELLGALPLFSVLLPWLPDASSPSSWVLPSWSGRFVRLAFLRNVVAVVG